MPAEPFTIEPAAWRDFGELTTLEKACFPEDAWPWWDLIGTLTFPGVIRLKAVVDGHMAGFIALDQRPRENAAWITTIGVMPAHRRAGIARALLEAGEAQVTLPLVRLCVRRSNQAAVVLYTQQGYHQTGVWEKYYIGNEDALVFEKQRSGAEKLPAAPLS